jgi:hypothetical protein
MVVAEFESIYTAKKAVLELLKSGFSRERIDLSTDRIYANPRDQEKPDRVHSEVVLDELQAGSGIGAGIGASLGLVGGLLVTLGELTLPFLASVTNITMSVVPEIVILAGAGLVAGGILGGMLSGLVGLGIPENEVRQYAKTVRRSYVTLMVIADWDAVDGTIAVLENHNPLDIHQKAIEWKKMEGNEKKLVERGLHVKISE